MATIYNYTELRYLIERYSRNITFASNYVYFESASSLVCNLYFFFANDLWKLRKILRLLLHMMAFYNKQFYETNGGSLSSCPNNMGADSIMRKEGIT